MQPRPNRRGFFVSVGLLNIMTNSNPAHRRSLHRRSIALMVLSTACFTANILLIRAFGHYGAANVWFLVCLRFVTGLLLISTLYHRHFQPLNLVHNPRLIARGIIGGLGTGCYYLTVVHLGAGRATFIGNTYVIWAGLIAVWALHERFNAALAIGCATTLAGLALLTNIVSTGLHPGIYDLLALLSAFASAMVVVMIRQLHAREHTSTIFAAQCVYGLLIFGALALHNTGGIPAMAWLIAILSSLVAAIGQLSMTRAYRDLPVGEGSLLQMLVPLGVAVGGVALFREHFSTTELAGAALILAGSILPSFRR